jgi:putative ABC transport system permease protein
LFVKVKPGTIKNTLNYLKNVIKELAPDFPFRYQFLDDVFDKQYISEKQTGTLFKYFTFLAIFISCMGLYSLVSYLAEQKTKEIGIRKVFGASVQQIIYLLTKEFVKLVMISSLIAFPIAYYVMSKWLQNYAYHTNINIRIFIISGVISVIIAFFTVFYRSFRAASANPTDSLKYE